MTMYTVFVLLVAISSMQIVSEDVDTDGNSLTIGAIADGNRPSACISITKFGYNFTVIWEFVDTTEPFKIFQSVQRFDIRGDVDMIILFHPYGAHPLSPQMVSTGNQKLIIIEKHRHDRSIEYNGTDGKSGDGNICLGKVPEQHRIDDPYCEIDLNRSSETISSPEMAFTVSVRALTKVIVENLHWRRISVIYQNDTAEETKNLVDNLSQQGVLFAIFNVDTTEDFNATLRHIYHSAMRSKLVMNFVVVCRSACVKKVLHIANKFDSRQTVYTTLMNQFSRWLVAFYGHTKEVSHFYMHPCVDDLDNVAIFAVPDVIGAEPRDLTDILDTVVTDLYSNVITNGSAGAVSKEDIIEQLMKKAKTWHQSARCVGYRFDTLLWTTDGRAFSTVGYVDLHGTISLKFELFPNIRYGYNKRQFVVSTLPYDPFVIKREEKVRDNITGELTGNITVRYEGFVMDLLLELSNVLNFTYHIIEPADQKWGGLEIKENLTFNGLIGQLQQVECDLVAAPISIQPDREVVVDFSFPFFYEYTTVVVKKPDLQSQKWRTLIDPFKWEVLVAIGVSLGVVTVLVFLLEKYNPYYDIPEHGQERNRLGGLHYLHNSFWYMYGCLLCQGGVHLPDSTAGRTFVSCWWLMCIVVVGIYCGNLIAFLTVTKEKPPFNTLAEMVRMTGYKWGTLGDTNWDNVFLTSNLSIFKSIGDGLRKFNATDPGVLNTGLRYHLDRVKEGEYAWIGDKTSIEIAMANECDLIKIKDEFMPMKYAFGFPENSPHNAMFSEQIMKLHESGLFQIWKRKWWPKSNFCALSQAPQATPISLIDVQSAFFVCCLGAFVGTVAFVLEIIVHRVRCCSKRNNSGKTIRMISSSSALSETTGF